jgi:hypothetical protein
MGYRPRAKIQNRPQTPDRTASARRFLRGLRPYSGNGSSWSEFSSRSYPRAIPIGIEIGSCSSSDHGRHSPISVALDHNPWPFPCHPMSAVYLCSPLPALRRKSQYPQLFQYRLFGIPTIHNIQVKHRISTKNEKGRSGISLLQ